MLDKLGFNFNINIFDILSKQFGNWAIPLLVIMGLLVLYMVMKKK